MNREIHVRFWEGLGVRFPWATHLARRQRERCSELVPLRQALVRQLPPSFRMEGVRQSLYCL